MEKLQSITRLLHSALASNFTLPRHTLKLTLALTDRCSFACQTCRIWTIRNPAEPSLDELDAFFSKNRQFAWIDVTGGEIFEREDLEEVLRIIYRSCGHLYLLHFPTNGWLPERTARLVELARRLRPAVRLIVTVSVDGPEEIHDQIRGRPESFRRAVDTIRHIRKMQGVQVFAGMTLGPRNIGSLDDTLQALATALPGFGPANLHINFVNRSAHYFRNIDCETAGIPALIAAIAEFKRRRGFPRTPELFLEYLYLSLIPRFFRTERCPIFCQSLSNNCFISSDWTLFPCTIWDRPLASLRSVDFDLATLWSSSDVQSARRAIARKECPNCWTPCEAYPSLMGMGRSWSALGQPSGQ